MRMRLLSMAVVVCLGRPALADYPPISLSNYNLIVTKDLHTTSEVEGRTLVGGNYFSFAGNNVSSQVAFQGHLSGLTNDGLVVGKNVDLNGGRLTVANGSAEIGGSIASDGTTVYVTNNPGNPGNHAASTGVGGLAGIGSAASSYLAFESGAIGSLSNTSNITGLPNGQPSTVSFNAVAGNNGLAVFNLTAAQASSIFGPTAGNNQIQAINLNLGAGVTQVVINVAGTGFDYQAPGNFVGGFTTAFARANVLWNFTQATTMNMENHEWDGAILAPRATLNSGTGGAFQGSVYVANLNQQIEVHMPDRNSSVNYTGYVAPVPEPGSIALLAIGVPGLLVLAGRRPRRPA